jgi:hypothetical protein
MSKKRVTFHYEFEYDEENLDEFDDAHVEQIAFETLEQNIFEMPAGTVEVVEE